MRQAKNSHEPHLDAVLLHCERHWHLGEMNLVVGDRFDVRGKRLRAVKSVTSLLDLFCGSEC